MMIRRSISIALVSVLAGALGMFTFAAPSSQTTGTWGLLGSLVDSRQGASATMLDDGRVLVAGGSNATGLLTSAEIVGADGGSVAVAAMNLPRTGHTATKLRDGRVLLTGGTGAGGDATATAEIFTPGTGTWTPVSMTVARRNHTATLLKDESGLVVIAGGENAGGTLASLEVFDPAAGAFAPLAAALSSPRARHAAAALPEGQVIVIGGSTGSSVLATSDIVNGLTGAVVAGPSLADARKNFTATDLLNGDVLVVGGVGGANGTTEFAAAEKFVTATGAFIPANGLPGPRQSHQAVRLPGNAGVLVVGGTAFDQPLRTVDLFLPASQVFRMTSPTEVLHTAGALAPLGTGLAVSAGGVGTAAVEAYAFATVTTDTDDYAPGETVYMSGSGWAPNEPVTLVLREVGQVHADRNFYALANGLGNFENAEFSPEEHHIGVRFYLTATQGASEAQTTFTDAANKASFSTSATGAEISSFTGVASGTCVTGFLQARQGNNLDTDFSPRTVALSSSPVGATFYAGSGCGVSSITSIAVGAGQSSVQLSFLINSATTATYTLTGNAAWANANSDASATIQITADTAPTVVSINRASSSPTYASTVDWTVTFSESVTGVGTGDFSLAALGVSGASITGASGSGTTWTVTADTGSSTGSLGLNLVDDDSIVDGLGLKLGGTGAGNGNLNGQVYTLSRTLTPAFTAANKVYDGNNTATILTRSFTTSVAGVDVELAGGTATFVNANVGNTKTVTGTGFSLDGDDAGRFLLSSTSATTTANITKAPATVTANNKTKTYGDANPALDATVTGEVPGGDTINYTLTTTATQFSSVPGSPYAITVTLGSNPNYDVTPTNGTLAIAARAATVTANNKTKTYGDANPTLDASVIGEVPGGDTINYTLATAAAQFSSVAGSPYAITVTLGSNPNYAVTPMNGTLTINAKTATVTANNKSKTYGDLNPALDATVVGEVPGGDTINYTLATTAAQFSSVAGSPYAITVTLGSNPNYSVTPANGTLTINAKTATVTANNKTKAYGDANPALDATVVGEVPGGDAINYTLVTAATQFSAVAGSPYSITVTLGSNPNYDVTPANGTLTISAKTATVTANNKTKTYGDANPALDATVTGEVPGGDLINYTLATTATQFSSVAGSPYAITVSLGSNPNYDVTPTNGTLTINAKTASVTANNKTKTYGDANPTLDAAVVGEVPGGDTINYSLTTTATQLSSVAGSPYAITVTLGSNPNYAVTPANGTLTINARTASVTANNKTKTYGDANPTLDAAVVGEVPGGDTINYSLTTTAAQLSSVAGSPYAITVTLGSNPNYDITAANGTLTINAKTATVTANNKAKTYGDANPTLDATVTGEVPGGDAINYTLATTATQFSSVVGSPYAITVALGSNPNYAVTPANGNLTINAKTASVTANNQTKTYGDANPTLDASVVGEVPGGDTINYTLATTATQFSAVAGSPYAITVTLGSNPNYDITPANGTLTINAKTATVTANNKTKTYGDLNPTLDASVIGEVPGGDPINYTLATTATQFSAVAGSPYAITVSLGSNPNYAVTPANGNLTINAKTASVTANNQTKTYADANPTLDATVTGEVPGGDTINYTVATTATQFSAVAGSPYAITVTLGSNPNYSVTPANGTLTINAKSATVTANNKTKVYGDANPTLDASVVGEVPGGDTINYTLATTATQFSAVASSPYAITVTLGSNPNYAVTPANGHLTINAKTASVTANNKTKTYGDANPALDATVTDEVPGGDAINYTLATTATQFSSVAGSPYAITVTLGSNPNYDVTPANGALTINAKTATVTANNKTKTYGDLNPTLDASVVGEVPGGDTINYTLATTATQFSSVAGSPYAIAVTLGPNPNYDVTPANGTLTISAKTASVSANNKSKTYGDANPSLDAIVSGEVPGGDLINYSLATTATQFSGVGPYPLAVALGSNPNYSVTSTDSTLTVNTRAATVTANNKTRTYGDANPTLDAAVVGQVAGGATINYTLATTATQFSSVAGSPYPIAVTLGSNPNYAVTPADGTLTVTVKTATVAAVNKTKIFGAAMTPDQSAPSTEFQVTGLVGTDAVATVTLTSPGYPAPAAPGSHTITPSNASGPGVANYNITYSPATLSITYSYGMCQGLPGRTILSPINPDGSSVFKQKSTVPAKFRVCDANGNSIGLPGTVTGFATILSSNGTYSEANEAPDSTTPDTAFRWSASDQQWIFNISTKSMAANKTYLFRIALGDGTFIDFAFGLK